MNTRMRVREGMVWREALRGKRRKRSEISGHKGSRKGLGRVGGQEG